VGIGQVTVIIAHRGLLEGPDEFLQNSPDQIRAALQQGFDAEIDLWLLDDKWWLGHDSPEHSVDQVFIDQPGLWIHCKNLPAFFALKAQDSGHNFFWHDSDSVVLSSRGYVWTYFGRPETRSPHSICVMPEVTYGLDHMVDEIRSQTWYGVCTDWPRILVDKL
jgi:hypothetical protein